MADQNIKTQLNIAVNPQVNKSSARGFAQQLGQMLAKELTPAIAKAIEAGFEKGLKSAQGQIAATARKSASAIGKDVGVAAGARVQKAAQGANPVQDVGQAAAIRVAQAARRGAMRAEGREESIQVKTERALDQRRGLERDIRISSELERNKQMKTDQREAIKANKEVVRKQLGEEKNKQKAVQEEAQVAAKVHRREAREQRKIGLAERNIARLEGREEAGVDQELEQLQPGLGKKLARSRSLNRLFPGARRIAAGTGLPIGLVRGGMSLGAMAGGIATGNPIAGALGGMVSGTQMGGLAGVGSIGGGLLAAGGAVIAAAGALFVHGMRQASAQAAGAQTFIGNLSGATQVAPSLQRASGLLRTGTMMSAFTGVGFGMSPQEGLQIGNQVSQTRGGWGGFGGMSEAQTEAMRLSRSFGIDAGTVGSIERARRRGGLSGGARAGAGFTTSLAERAVGLGFQGSEINEFVTQQAGMMTQARDAGTQFNPTNFGNTVGALSPMIGQAQAARMAGGMQGSLNSIATKGIAGAPNPTIGLMMMQAFGGLQLGKGGGVGAADIWNSQRNIEKNGQTPEGWRNMAKMAKGAAGGSPGLQRVLLQRTFADMGISAGTSIIDALVENRATDSDLRSTITGAAEAGRDAASLSAGGGRVRAELLTPEESKNAASIEATNLGAGMKALPGMQALDASLAQLATQAGGAASAVDGFKAKMVEFANWVLP